jgi:CubicO group peptidase (beta-lactamase class C family)
MKSKLSVCYLLIIAVLNFSTGFSITRVEARSNPTATLAYAKTFDLNLFEKNIRKALDGKSVGYAYAINLNGQLKRKGAGGYAILKRDLADGTKLSDPKGIPQSPDKRMNIASVTKTLTATTVLKILQDKLAQGHPNLTVDSKVEPFLPTSWVKGPGIKDLTFKELLSQFSGMNDNGGDTGIAALKAWIAKGVTRPKNDYVYINANLAIFRIIIPFMTMPIYKRAHHNIMAKMNEEKFDEVMSSQYIEEVNDLVLKPMGMPTADCKNTDPQPTRLYNTANQAKGYVVGDWTKVSGGGGWFLSAVDLARFLAHLRYNNQILSPATRKIMDDHFLGWRKVGGSPTGDYGIYHAHGGGLFYGSGDNQTGMTSCIMNFPNGAQVALLINSLGTYSSKYTLLKEAFDNAWVFGEAAL